MLPRSTAWLSWILHWRERSVAAKSIAVLGAALVLAILMTAAQQDRGKDLFERRCSGCHALDKEKEGPRLRGVYGRKSGSVAGFQYSDALKAAGITWDDQKLEKWLQGPEKLVPGTDMTFEVADARERTAIIGYLKQLSTDASKDRAVP